MSVGRVSKLCFDTTVNVDPQERLFDKNNYDYIQTYSPDIVIMLMNGGMYEHPEVLESDKKNAEAYPPPCLMRTSSANRCTGKLACRGSVAASTAVMLVLRMKIAGSIREVARHESLHLDKGASFLYSPTVIANLTRIQYNNILG